MPSDSSGNNVILVTVVPDSVVTIVVLVTVDPDCVVSLVVPTVVESDTDGAPELFMIQSSKCETEVKQCGWPASHVPPVT